MMRKLRLLVVITAGIFIITFLLIGQAASITPTPKPPTALPWVPAATVVGNNALSGTVHDSNGKGIPNAKVTLYYTAWAGTEYKAKDVAKINNNPQYTSNGGLSPAGLYVFTGLPQDVYMLTAEINGTSVSKFINVAGGTETEDITIPGYVGENATKIPNPTYRPSPSTSNPPKTDLGKIFFDVLRIALIGVIGVQLVVSIVVITLHAGRRH
jgi:hypothetical protein